jgi:hypothetical protein
MRFDDQGLRVVSGQRALKALGDPMLGHTSIDGRPYYVRQMKNMKASIISSARSAWRRKSILLDASRGGFVDSVAPWLAWCRQDTRRRLPMLASPSRSTTASLPPAGL